MLALLALFACAPTENDDGADAAVSGSSLSVYVVEYDCAEAAQGEVRYAPPESYVPVSVQGFGFTAGGEWKTDATAVESAMSSGYIECGSGYDGAGFDQGRVVLTYLADE